MSRILITGVAGFLGSHLARRLLSLNHSVIGLDLVHPQDAWRLKLLLPDIDYRWQSLQSPVNFTPDAVIHCAATTDVRMSAQDVLNAVDVNVKGTAALLSGLMDSRVIRLHSTRFIQISTHSVYGKPPDDGTFDEETPCHPTNLYGATKLAQESLAMAYCHSFGLPVTVLRLSLMYGENERAGALVSTFIKKALAGETMTLDGGGHQTRDLNYVENAIDAVVLALDNPKAVGEIFNITGGEDVSVRRLAEESILYAGMGQVKDGPAREGEEGSLRLDGTKARCILGYTPAVNFTTGFSQTFRSIAR